MEEAENAHRLLENTLYYYTTQTLNQVIHKTVDTEELTQTRNQVIHKTLDMEEAGEAMVAYSCSKNFGLYRERTGCFLVLGDTQEGIAAATTHVADNGRATWSMPPAHGAGIVATILGDAQLRAEWETELNAMRTRMKGLRASLADALVTATGSNALAALKSQNGMFSQLPLTAAQTVELREKHGVYMPSSGRINIAGLHPKDIPVLADILAGYL